MWIRVPGACAPELMVSSLVAPPKPLKNPLVSNEATASPVGTNGQKLSSFDGSSLFGTLLQRTICLAPQYYYREEDRLQLGPQGSPTPGWHNLRYRCCPVAVVVYGMSRYCA